MNKVITINLNGKAYQLEEDGFAKLKAYLAEAASRLENDPDKDEIIADLERAVAEKLDRLLDPNKTVVTDKEVDEVIKEMGPVEGESKETNGGNEDAKKSSTETKRLYKIREGKMIAGVCNGLAAYFNIDVVLVRLIFVGLFFLTHGAWMVVYIVMAIVMPRANTSAEVAAARGEPFTAQDFINRAREEYTKFADKSEWKKWKHEIKHKMRQEKWQQKHDRCVSRRGCHSPLRGLLIAFITIAWIIGGISIMTANMVFGYALPATFPLWISLLLWLFLYSFVVSIFRCHHSYGYYNDGHNHFYYQHNSGFMETLGSIAFIVIIGWAIYHYVPSSHIYFWQARDVWQNFLISIHHP